MTMVRKAKGLAKGILKVTGLLPWISRRTWIARRYLRGKGLEIGAMHRPLKLPSGATAQYVDIASKEESIRKFPELDPKDMVRVDYIADGFKLEGVPKGSFDFLIANHVLEHTPEPIGTLATWLSVLKGGGRLFCTLPLADKGFDKGRGITTFAHLVEDHRAATGGDAEALKRRNLEHYEEWLRISEPNILLRPAVTGEEYRKRLAAMAAESSEIHFHTFSVESARDIFDRLSREVLGGFAVLEVAPAKEEVIVILEKRA